MRAFPVNALRFALTATSAGTARVSLANAPSDTFVCYNGSDSVVRLKSGSSSVASSTTGFPIPPGAWVVLRKNPGDTHIAAYAASNKDVEFFFGDGEFSGYAA